jgi:hypothetical protein
VVLHVFRLMMDCVCFIPLHALCLCSPLTVLLIAGARRPLCAGRIDPCVLPQQVRCHDLGVFVPGLRGSFPLLSDSVGRGVGCWGGVLGYSQDAEG